MYVRYGVFSQKKYYRAGNTFFSLPADFGVTLANVIIKGICVEYA